MQKSTDQNRRNKKIAPIVVTALVLLYVVPLVVILVLAAGAGMVCGIAGMLPVLLCYLFIGGAVVVGILKALFQRLEEIDSGEEEDASQY